MTVKYRIAVATTLFLGLTWTITGQGAPVPQQSSSAQPTFRVSVDLVTSDVIVRNKRGQFVPNLTKDDFAIYEDGVKQDLSSFVLVHGGRAFTQQLAAAPRQQEGIILPPPRPTTDATGRIFVLFVDDLHFDFRDTSRVRQLFKKITDSLIHEGDLFGIVSTGPSSLSIDLTYDRGRLKEASDKITGSGLRPSEIMQSNSGPQGSQELRYRAHVAFSTAYELMKNLTQVHNRRKAVVVISNGYDFDPFAGSALGLSATGSPFLTQAASAMTTLDPANAGRQFADADLAVELNELTRAANRANATIYTVDPRGLVAGADLDEQVDPSEWATYVRKSQDSLRVLADNTGGVAVVNTNDFDRALKRIDAETSDYYVLGYYSKNPDPTQRRRAIEIKVARKGDDGADLEVLYRKEYTLRPLPAVSSPQR